MPISNFSHFTRTAALLSLLTALATPALAQSANSHEGHGSPLPASAQAPAPAPDTELSEGEIRKVNTATGKLTIQHGPLKNLNMPGMTMVFQVRDTALLAHVKAGDKVRFRAEADMGGYVVTTLQSAP